MLEKIKILRVYWVLGLQHFHNTVRMKDPCLIDGFFKQGDLLLRTCFSDSNTKVVSLKIGGRVESGVYWLSHYVWAILFSLKCWVDSCMNPTGGCSCGQRFLKHGQLVSIVMNVHEPRMLANLRWSSFSLGALCYVTIVRRTVASGGLPWNIKLGICIYQYFFPVLVWSIMFLIPKYYMMNIFLFEKQFMYLYFIISA